MPSRKPIPSRAPLSPVVRDTKLPAVARHGLAEGPKPDKRAPPKP